jgi:dTDP-4-amino-4,6-dideoxygalactose transaminase
LNIPFHRPIIPASLDELYEDSIRDGWITTGPITKKFESKLQEIFESDNVIAVNSCTAALHIALASKNFKPNDKFIVPTYTFVASVEVGEYLGMHPILIDSQKDGYNIDLNQVEDVLKKDNKIKAIIPVHFGGETVQMDLIFDLANKYNLFVLEDAAHAFESKSKIGKVGNTNHAAAFSFYANKNITTGGEGGALSTNDCTLAEKMRKLSLHGMSKDGYKRFQSNGKWAYDVSELGYKYNMTDISASFGLWQLRYFNNWLLRRIEIANEYNIGLDGIEGIICPTKKVSTDNAWHLYIIRIIPNLWKISRNELINKINQKGIGTSVHYIPVHMHSYYKKKYGFKPDSFPQSKTLSETVISLPLYPALKDEEVSYIAKTILGLWEKYKV